MIGIRLMPAAASQIDANAQFERPRKTQDPTNALT